MTENQNKNRIIILILALYMLIINPAFAIGERPADFVGDSFFGNPIMDEKGQFIPHDDYEAREREKNNNPNKTIPPVKLIRLKIKAYHYAKEEEKQKKLNPQEEVTESVANEEQFYETDDYKKAKTSYEHNFSRYQEAKDKLDYYESILFNIENSNIFEELNDIKNELIDLGLIQDKKENETSKIQKIEFRGFEIYIGKNNKQNDYLISKIAQAEDIWFHAYNCPSSHVLLKVRNDEKEPKPEVLEYAARLVKENSPMKNSTKASIIYTKRKNLKKPLGGVLGYVIYKNEKEIVIQ